MGNGEDCAVQIISKLPHRRYWNYLDGWEGGP